MKKVYLFGFIASAALAMTSCASDDTTENGGGNKNAIEFGTYLGRDAQTRGAVTDNNTLTTNGFGVFATYTGTNDYSTNNYSGKMDFMYNQQVTSSNGSWTYSPLKYWPNNDGDKLSFFAYAPYNVDGVTLSDKAKTGNPTITFKVQDNVADQKDLTVDAQTNQTKPAVSKNVTFTFKHVLARVGFNVEAMFDKVNTDATGSKDNKTDNGTKADKTTISVKSVKLIGKFDKTATIDLATSNWSDVADAADNVEFTWSTDDFDSKVASDVTTSKQQLNSVKNYAMIIPQNFTSKEVKIEVTYTVTTTDDKLDGGKSEITNTVTSDPFAFNFEQGKAYMFNLHLGMTSVKFDASVSGWDETSDETVVNLPINTQSQN